MDRANKMNAPQMAWDALLKKTDARLYLITNPTWDLMIESGMRGHVCTIRMCYIKAINHYLAADNDPTSCTSNMIYLEAYNSMVGRCLSSYPLDTSAGWGAEFGHTSWQGFTHLDPVAYILQRDLEYPIEHHVLRYDLILASERVQ